MNFCISHSCFFFAFFNRNNKNKTNKMLPENALEAFLGIQTNIFNMNLNVVAFE